jgi:hypothetical protein
MTLFCIFLDLVPQRVRQVFFLHYSTVNMHGIKINSSVFSFIVNFDYELQNITNLGDVHGYRHKKKGLDEWMNEWMNKWNPEIETVCFKNLGFPRKNGTKNVHSWWFPFYANYIFRKLVPWGSVNTIRQCNELVSSRKYCYSIIILYVAGRSNGSGRPDIVRIKD